MTEKCRGPADGEKILVIVPAYNEEANIAGTVKAIRTGAPGADILVVDDGSSDRTLSEIIGTGTMFLHHCVNLGIGGAVQSGYRFARRHGYDYAVQIDGDGQHDPAYIYPMIEWMKRENIDVGIGSRYVERKGFQSSAARRMGIRFLSGLIRLLYGASVSDVTSGYRIVNRRFIELFSDRYADDYPETDSIPVILLHHGRLAEYPVVMKERQGGKSSINLKKSLYLIIKVSLSILLCRVTDRTGTP